MALSYNKINRQDSHIIISIDIMKKILLEASFSVVAIITISEQEIDDSVQILAKSLNWFSLLSFSCCKR
jgi:hypothetical protein